MDLRSNLLALLLAVLCSTGAASQSGAALGAAKDASRTAEAPASGEAPALSPSLVQLRADLDELLARPGTRDARFSIMVTSLDRGDVLFARTPDLPLAPASNMKIYSTAAALYYLGPEFRYSTYLLTDGEIRGGTLYGDVVLQGTGDPSLSERLLGDPLAPFREMATALAGLGIHTVAGDVIGDGSWFDEAWRAPAWEDDDRLSWYAAPVGGLTFAENMVRVRLAPGGTVGAPARVTTAPETHGLAVRNEVRTVTSGPTRVTFAHGPDAIVASGTIRRGHPGVERWLPVVDPANYAAAALRAVLEGNGITVTGQTRSGAVTLQEPRIVKEHVSPPLAELARVTNHVSHNLFAEALLKTLGRAVLGEGSFHAGGTAVQRFLATETTVDRSAVLVVDGSGLSRPNRATARATVSLLEYLWRSDTADEFISSLPVAGSALGLRRMYDSPAAGNLRAKTGTIRRVSALSGYLTTADGERLAFSILSNGIPAGWQAKALENAIAVRLASFRR